VVKNKQKQKKAAVVARTFP